MEVQAMTDAELGKSLGLTEAETAIVVPKLAPEKRAAYERLIKLGDDLNLWAAGLGPKPQGVLICHGHRRGK
jgi:hypothetical protein